MFRALALRQANIRSFFFFIFLYLIYCWCYHLFDYGGVQLESYSSFRFLVSALWIGLLVKLWIAWINKNWIHLSEGRKQENFSGSFSNDRGQRQEKCSLKINRTINWIMPSFKVCGGIETNENKSINVSNGLDFLNMFIHPYQRIRSKFLKYVYSRLTTEWLSLPFIFLQFHWFLSLEIWLVVLF